MTRLSDMPGRKRIRGQWYWVARADARKAGFEPRTWQLPDDVTTHPAACQRLWAEMLEWIGGSTRRTQFDGTIGSLATIYQTTDVSPYRSIEYTTQLGYSRTLASITAAVGKRRVDALTGLDFRRWHANWAAPKGNGKPRIRSAQEHIKLLRIIMNFGAEQRLHGCATVADILSRIEFATPRQRTEIMTRAMAEAIIETALAEGDVRGRSMALAQALQFETALRQTDVIGHWRPRPRLMALDPCAIVDGGSYWADGVTWADLAGGKLTVRPLKSGKGRTLTFDVALYPLLVRVLDTIPDASRAGPMIVGNDGLPFTREHYGHAWRKLADKAGVPKAIWNRDSRAGAITETTDAATLEDARHVAGHSTTAMTARYSRGAETKIRRAQEARIGALKQAKNEHGNEHGNDTVTGNQEKCATR